MALTPEDVQKIQELLNGGLMPQVEKLIDDKIGQAVGGLSSVVQGILQTSAPEEPAGNGHGPLNDKLALLTALTPLLQLLPMFQHRQQQDPMAMFNQQAAMMKTASDVMLAPVLDIWRSGMSFGVNAVSLAARATGQLPDGQVFDQLIRNQGGPVSAGSTLGAHQKAGEPDLAAEIERLAKL